MIDMTRRRILGAVALTPFAGLLACGRSGAQTAPSLIDGRTFSGARTLAGTGGEGGEGLRARSGLTIRNSHFVNLGNGAVRVNVPTDRLVIEDCDGQNLYRFLEDTSSTSTNPAVLSNFALRRIVARDLDHGFSRIRYASANGVIEDVTAYGGDQGDDYCVGFQLDDTAQNITYQRVAAHGFRETGRPAANYWNGDGFSDERGNRAIRYLSCTATDSTDGGFDLKSADVLLEGCVARGNKRNYRLWSSGTLRDCRSEEPVWRGGNGGPAHFSFHGATERYVLENPVVRAGAENNAPVFLFDTTVRLRLEIVNADIEAPGAPLIAVTGGPEPEIVWIPPRDQQPIRVAREH